MIDRVVTGRRLWQPGKHGDLAKVQLVQRFAEVHQRGGAEAVGALAEVNLVDVKLQDFVFGQTVFDLEREQRLIELAAEGFLGGEKEVSCHLHGDGAGTLPGAGGGEIGQCCAYHANVVDPAVFVKALVLGCNDCLAQYVGRLLDLDEGSLLLAEFPDQVAFDAEDLQGNLGLIGGQRLQGRQVRIGHHHGISDHQDDRGRDRGQPKQAIKPPTGGHGIG